LPGKTEQKNGRENRRGFVPGIPSAAGNTIRDKVSDAHEKAIIGKKSSRNRRFFLLSSLVSNIGTGFATCRNLFISSEIITR